jgi:hypothetical protein
VGTGTQPVVGTGGGGAIGGNVLVALALALAAGLRRRFAAQQMAGRR